MTSAALTFDRLAYIDRLTAAGFDDKQARAQAEALDAALRDGVATRADRRGQPYLRREIRDVETKLDAKIETTSANLKVEILRWLIVTQLAPPVSSSRAVKFVK